MDALPPPSPIPPHAVPAMVSRVVFAELCARLPPPAIDTPENRAERDAVAMDAAIALQPTDAFEAKLAAQLVAADDYVGDTLRLAAECRSDLDATLRCRARPRRQLHAADACPAARLQTHAGGARQGAGRHAPRGDGACRLLVQGEHRPRRPCARA